MAYEGLLHAACRNRVDAQRRSSHQGSPAGQLPSRFLKVEGELSVCPQRAQRGS